jgi:hypothetical protein
MKNAISALPSLLIFVVHSAAAALATGRAEVSVGERAAIMPPDRSTTSPTPTCAPADEAGWSALLVLCRTRLPALEIERRRLHLFLRLRLGTQRADRGERVRRARRHPARQRQPGRAQPRGARPARADHGGRLPRAGRQLPHHAVRPPGLRRRATRPRPMVPPAGCIELAIRGPTSQHRAYSRGRPIKIFVKSGNQHTLAQTQSYRRLGSRPPLLG